MTATTRTTRAEMLRNDALTKYEARVRRLCAEARKNRLEGDGLSSHSAIAIMRGASRMVAAHLQRADEFEAAGGAA